MSLFPLTTKMFPEEQATDRTYQLHHYIAHGESKKADFWMARMQPDLNAQDPVYRLTPLAVAALAGDVLRAQKLLDGGADAKLADVQGWTPLHFATLQQDEAMMTTLKAHDAALETLQNRSGQTPAQLFARVQCQSAPDEEQVFFYRNDEGDIVAGTAAKFREMTGASYGKQTQGSPEAFAQVWERSARELTPQLLAAYVSEIAEGRLDPVGAAKVYVAPSKAGLGLFARERIPAGTSIALYTGVLSQQPLDLEYYMQGIDAKDVRSVAALANDGFPNAAIVPSFFQDGFGMTPCLKTLVAIERDQEITYNYGHGHPAKEQARLELNASQLEQYFKRVSIDRLFMDFENTETKTRAVEMIRYLMDTPGAVLHLLLKGIWSTDQLLLLGERVGATGIEVTPFTFTWVQDYVVFFAAKQSADVKQRLTSLIPELPIVVILYLMRYLAAGKPLSSAQLTRYLEPMSKIALAHKHVQEVAEKGGFDEANFTLSLSLLKEFPFPIAQSLFADGVKIVGNEREVEFARCCSLHPDAKDLQKYMKVKK